jgi:hypothetical protein
MVTPPPRVEYPAKKPYLEVKRKYLQTVAEGNFLKLSGFFSLSKKNVFGQVNLHDGFSTA